MPLASQNLPKNSSTFGVDWFEYEAAQLTPEVIESLASYNLSQFDVNNASIFGFAQIDVAAAPNQKRTEAACKYMPGDAAWPSPLTWTLLDLLLGSNALITGSPAAAVCYASWPQYDQAQCDEITANWTDADWM